MSPDAQIKVPVCVFAFDCLFVDGASLLRAPLSERRAALVRAFPNLRPGHFALAHSWELRAPEQARPDPTKTPTLNASLQP